MTVSATAPVCYQLISPKSPEYASPAMKLCQPLREPVESRHSDGPGCAAANSHRTQPAGPSALQSQRETHLPAFEFQPPARGTAERISLTRPNRRICGCCGTVDDCANCLTRGRRATWPPRSSSSDTRLKPPRSAAASNATRPLTTLRGCSMRTPVPASSVSLRGTCSVRMRMRPPWRN